MAKVPWSKPVSGTMVTLALKVVEEILIEKQREFEIQSTASTEPRYRKASDQATNDQIREYGAQERTPEELAARLAQYLDNEARIMGRYEARLTEVQTLCAWFENYEWFESRELPQDENDRRALEAISGALVMVALDLTKESIRDEQRIHVLVDRVLRLR